MYEQNISVSRLELVVRAKWCKHKGRLIRTSYQICYGSACKHVFAYVRHECADEFNLNPWTYLICGFRLRIESRTNLGSANRCGICHRSYRKLVYWFKLSERVLKYSARFKRSSVLLVVCCYFRHLECCKLISSDVIIKFW